MFMIFGTLIYLSINGHLMLLGALAESFIPCRSGAHIGQDFSCRWCCGRARVFDSGTADRAARGHCALVIVNLPWAW